MKGKNLYNLIVSLNRKEKKQLAFELQGSKDKRYSYFEKLLSSGFDNLIQLNKNLEEILSKEIKTKNAQEADKLIRRFIDFAKKKIEDLKLQNHLAENLKTRNWLLSEISEKNQQESLHRYYLRKTSSFVNKSNDSHLMSLCLDRQINIFGREQKDKNLKKIKQLLNDKSKNIDHNYHQQHSIFYRIISGLCLDDIRLLEDYNGTENVYDKLTQFARSSQNLMFAGEYYISRARFAFYHKDFGKYIKEAELFISESKMLTEEKEKLSRRINFLKMVGGFHRGEQVENLLKYSKEVIACGIKYKYKDSIVFFYYQLFNLILNISETEEDKEWSKFFYTKETKFYDDFIIGLKHLKYENNLDLALRNFYQLTYSPNFYVSLWSKFMEFKINFIQGKHLLCKSLIERINITLKKNEHRPFTYEASRYVCKKFKNELKSNEYNNELPENFSPFHLLLTQIN